MQVCVALRNAPKGLECHCKGYVYSHVAQLSRQAAEKQLQCLLLTVKSGLTVHRHPRAQAQAAENGVGVSDYTYISRKSSWVVCLMCKLVSHDKHVPSSMMQGLRDGQISATVSEVECCLITYGTRQRSTLEEITTAYTKLDNLHLQVILLPEKRPHNVGVGEKKEASHLT